MLMQIILVRCIIVIGVSLYMVVFCNEAANYIGSLSKIFDEHFPFWI